MSRVIKLTESQFRQIVGIKEDINKGEKQPEKISKILLNKFGELLNNLINDYNQQTLEQFTTVLLEVMCKLSNKQEPDGIITEQAIKFLNIIQTIDNLDDNNKLKQAIQTQKYKYIMGYLTMMMKNAQTDIYREEQKHNIQSIDNEDTKYLENTISQQSGGTRMNFDPIHYLEFLMNPEESPLKKSPKAVTFIKTLYNIIKRTGQSNVDFFDQDQRKKWMSELYNIYAQTLCNTKNSSFLSYADARKNLSTESGKLYLTLLKLFATIFGKGGEARNIKQGDDYKPNFQNKFGKYFDSYQNYLKTHRNQNDELSNEIGDMFNDFNS